MLENFGAGKHKDVGFWSMVVRQALIKRFIQKDIENYGLLKIDEKGHDFIKIRFPFRFLKIMIIPIPMKKKITSGDLNDPEQPMRNYSIFLKICGKNFRNNCSSTFCYFSGSITRRYGYSVSYYP